jgi:hypothetical protein
MAKNTRWDRNLSVAPDAEGLIGHAGAVLLRKLADQCGLTSALGAALGRKGKSPLIDRGVALVSMAVAITLGAASMSDIAVLAHQEPVLGPRRRIPRCGGRWSWLIPGRWTRSPGRGRRSGRTCGR